jgi:hypothetical protein
VVSVPEGSLSQCGFIVIDWGCCNSGPRPVLSVQSLPAPWRAVCLREHRQHGHYGWGMSDGSKKSRVDVNLPSGPMRMYERPGSTSSTPLSVVVAMLHLSNPHAVIT